MGKKERLDVLLVQRGFSPSRERAKASIMAGLVFVDGQREDKPGALFKPEGLEICLRENPLPFVSRGGLKLQKALDLWQMDLSGLVCMDVGASTGGFTDCMLQRGASKVYAIDVGYGQLDWKLRIDERVVSMEKTNFRYLKPGQLAEPADFFSMDVSFISLVKMLPPAWPLLSPGARGVVLVKPQFEAGRELVGKKGVVRHPHIWAQVLRKVMFFAGAWSYQILGLSYSPIQGPEGNVEFLLCLQKAKTLPEPVEGRDFEQEFAKSSQQGQEARDYPLEEAWEARLAAVCGEAAGAFGL